MGRGVWIVISGIALGTVLPGCATRRTGRQDDREAMLQASGSPLPDFQAGRWLVSERTKVWKVLEERNAQAPILLGYVTAHDYRQQSGGPAFNVYTVTRLNRKDEIGHIDQMGRAVKYEPRRGGGYDAKDVGQATLEESVGAIFATESRIILEKTTERRLAFEALDTSGNGLLEKIEIKSVGDPITSADANHDGVVDQGEFDAIDRL